MTQKEEQGLDKTIGYTLIIGVIITILLEINGMVVEYFQTGNIYLTFTTPWRLTGDNFFAYSVGLVSSFNKRLDAITIMALGIVVLMFTPYIRVIASVAYFLKQKDLKYLVITLFVLVVITVSLAVH